MIISHAYRFALVTPPKTASTSLHYFFSQPPFCDKPWIPDWDNQRSTVIPEGCGDYLVVTCWRHPLDREVSLWAHSQSTASRRYDSTEPMTFAEFVRDFQPTAKPFYAWPQSRWLGETRVDVMMGFAELNHAVTLVRPVVAARRAGHKLRPLRRLNTTLHARWLDLYTPELRRLVSARFREDFELPTKLRRQQRREPCLSS